MMLALVIVALVLTTLSLAGIVVCYLDNRCFREELEETRGDYLECQHTVSKNLFQTEAELQEFSERQRRLIEGLGAKIGVSFDSEAR